VAGCGSSGGDESVAKVESTNSSEAAAPEDEAGGEGGGEEPALAYTECMRENGISDFPEPVEGRFKIQAGPGSECPRAQYSERAQ